MIKNGEKKGSLKLKTEIEFEALGTIILICPSGKRINITDSINAREWLEIIKEALKNIE